jgi:2-hydroxychromene-2-carboxylate isomerase
MGGPLEFWYEFASTYSYPAAMRVEDVAAASGIPVVWNPFLLGPIFGSLGWTTSPFNLQPAKGAYMWRDLKRTCADLGLTFRKPDPFPQNGLLAARLAMALPDDGTRARFSRAVYQAQFADGVDLSDVDGLKVMMGQLGIDADDTLTRCTQPAIKEALRAQTEQAQAHGIFGAPTWRTPDGELFWGNDRLEDALRWMQR